MESTTLGDFGRALEKRALLCGECAESEQQIHERRTDRYTSRIHGQHTD